MDAGTFLPEQQILLPVRAPRRGNSARRLDRNNWEKLPEPLRRLLARTSRLLQDRCLQAALMTDRHEPQKGPR